MKSDEQLTIDVRAALDREPRVRESEIGLAVADGVVTLTGTVGAGATKVAAERAAASVEGVRVVADDLAVRLRSREERTDTEIAHQVVNALAWQIEIPHERVTARVVDGWVSLAGDVDWAHQRVAATNAVRFLTGVRGVTNGTTIREHVSTADVSTRVEAALARIAGAAEHEIDVRARNGRVTLDGTVHSAAARRDAENAAWDATGVTAVDDRIVVAGAASIRPAPTGL